MIGLLLFVALFVWGFVQFGRKCGGTLANRKFVHGVDMTKDWPNGTLIRVTNPADQSQVLRDEIWYYGVRRRIGSTLTKRRLLAAVRGGWL